MREVFMGHLRLIRSFLRFHKPFRISVRKFWKGLLWYGNQYFSFWHLPHNESFSKKQTFFYPCIGDNTGITYVEPVYFYQDTWAAKHIFQRHPAHHVDVGSLVKTVGLISQFVPVTMIDIRPPNVKLDNLFFRQGDILNLPFDDNSVESLSSLCVVEHIGLGRYGDQLDQFGSEKAIQELQRVIKPGGVLLISLPVDRENRIYFNAHRAFTRHYIIELFKDWHLIEEKYQYGDALVDQYSTEKGFGTGLYCFKKQGN